MVKKTTHNTLSFLILSFYTFIILLNLAIAMDWVSHKNTTFFIATIFCWIYLAATTYIMIGGDHLWSIPGGFGFFSFNLVHIIAVLLSIYVIYKLFVKYFLN